jgi:hypothetical protein
VHAGEGVLGELVGSLVLGQRMQGGGGPGSAPLSGRWPTGSPSKPVAGKIRSITWRSCCWGLRPRAGHGPVVAHPRRALHLTIHGRTATGIALKVYGGIPFAHCAGLVPLALNESEGVSLDEIYTLLALPRDHHHAAAAGMSA